MIVVGNKCDMATDEQIAEFEAYVKEKGYDFFPIMAAIRYQVDPLLNRVTEMLSKLPPVVRYEPEAVVLPEPKKLDKSSISIRNEGGVYIVESEPLLQVMRSINVDDYESMQYFQRVLISSGVIEALREAGCGEGDTVSMYDMEFDFVE